MPGSSPHGKAWMVERLMGERPKRVLDIGAGCGTYAQLFRARWPGSHWTAVEVWEPYVDAYKLREQYDVVHVSDARTWEPEGRYDLAFLGDVLEHMTSKEARVLLDRIRGVADMVVVSIPIVHYPQGALCGNPFETHVEEDWSHERVCAALGEPTEFVNDAEIGAYIYRATIGPTGLVGPLGPGPCPRGEMGPRGEAGVRVKVAVYAISKNEAACAQRWAASTVGADYRVVTDTGSTDGTQKVLRDAGVTVHEIVVDPWRFDVARTASLSLIPGDADYCIALDLDEVLLPGWRAALEDAKARGLTRPRYPYTWSWLADGTTPDIVYNADKIHARQGYRWTHPVHEVLQTYGIEEVQGDVTLAIHHHPDPTARAKPDYLPLLKLAVTEAPDDDRNAHYYARELFFRGQLNEAAAEFRRHLALPSAKWKPERAASMRYLAKCEPARQMEWLARAALEAPNLREAWVDLAKVCMERNEWVSCYAAAIAALAITKRELLYLTEAFAWGSAPHDYAALAAYNLGKNDEAIRHGTRAVELNPTDPRLRQNLAYYRGEVAEALALPTSPADRRPPDGRI